MSVHVSHITSCAGNAMYQKSPNHSTLTYPNYLPVRFKTRKCPHHTPTGPAASSSSQNSPRGSQPLTAQLTLPSLWTLWGGHTLAFKITLKMFHCHRWCPYPTLPQYLHRPSMLKRDQEGGLQDP